MNGRAPRYGEIVWARLPPSRRLLEVPSRLSALSSALPALSHAFPPPDCSSALLGMRWWPAEILHSRSLRPEGSKAAASSSAHFNRLGFFAVRLFGLYTSEGSFNGVEGVSKPLSTEEVDGKKIFPVCLWTTRSRVFPYEEGDDKRDGSCSSSDDSESSDESSDNESGSG